MKKIIIKILILTISLISISIYSNAAGNETIELVPSTNSIGPGDTISVNVNIKNQSMGISGFDCFINYNDNIFEKITKADITTNISEDVIDTFNYNEDNKKIIFTLSNCTENIETIITINMKVKSSITQQETSNIYLSHMNLYNMDNDIYLIEDKDSSEIIFNVNSEELYLSTEIYKIGENDEDTSNYQDGDKYLTRVSPNTTISEFIANLKTNGNISIYNADGEEETNLDELVKTGMTIKVSKEGYTDIILTVVVTGDVNGDGIVDITDLVKVRQQIQQLFDIDEKVTKFDEKQDKAGDINEDLFIDITDLVKIRRHIQEIEIL